MYASRVEVIGSGDFDAREWLRRDVLWASLMSPYTQQMDDFLKDQGYPALQQHNGNVSRRDTYSKESDVTARSLSFFHQGKNIAGLISSAVMFRAFMHGIGEGRMSALAQKETTQWVEDSRQHDGQVLPTFTIQPGGSPRSAGPRVEMLQPVFRDILDSESYRGLQAAA